MKSSRVRGRTGAEVGPSDVVAGAGGAIILMKYQMMTWRVMMEVRISFFNSSVSSLWTMLQVLLGLSKMHSVWSVFTLQYSLRSSGCLNYKYK